MKQTVQLLNQSRPLPAPARVNYCASFLCRLRGLMFRARLSRDEGLLLVQARDSRADTSIHMLFVPFDLCVVWINNAHQVVDKVLARAWRPAYFPRAAARYTLEIHPERWEDYQIGDTIRIVNA